MFILQDYKKANLTDESRLHCTIKQVNYPIINLIRASIYFPAQKSIHCKSTVSYVVHGSNNQIIQKSNNSNFVPK